MSTNQKIRRNNIAAAVSLSLALGMLIYLTLIIGRNIKLTENLKTEKLNAETLLSARLSAEKDLNKLKEEIQALTKKNAQIGSALNEVNESLADAEERLRRSQQQNASIVSLKKQSKELQQIRTELEQQLDNLKSTYQQMERSRDELTNTIALLQAENKKLRDEIMLASLKVNNSLVESSKKNHKQTIKAKSIKKLITTIDVPANAENLSYKITSPDGKELADKEDALSVKVIREGVKKPQAFYAATNNSVAGHNSKRVELTFEPTAKLASGIYTIDVLNDNLSIGSLQVKLK